MDDLISTADVARLAGTTRQAVLSRARRGTLPGRLVGSYWVFDRVQVERQLARERVERQTRWPKQTA